MKRLVILCMLTLICVSSVSAEVIEKTCTASIPTATHTGTLNMYDTLEAGMVFCLNTESRCDGFEGFRWMDSNQLAVLEAITNAQGLVYVENTTTHITVSYNDEGDRWEYRYCHYKISDGGSGGGGGGSVRKIPMILN